MNLAAMNELRELVNGLKVRGVRLEVSDVGELTARGKLELLTDSERAIIKKNKTALIDYIRAGSINKSTLGVGVADSKASSSQERMWYLSRINSEHGERYNEIACINIIGNLDAKSFRAACEAVWSSHDMFRTAFSHGVDGLVQLLVEPVAAPIYEASVDNDGVNDFIRSIALEKFNLEKCPLARFVLITTPDCGHYFAMIAHHIITDGWSVDLVLHDIIESYRAIRSDSKWTKEQPKKSYFDYCHEQASRLNPDTLESELSFWKRYLENAPDQIAFPPCADTVSQGDLSSFSCAVPVGKDVTRHAKAYAKANSVTLYTLLFSCWRVLLHRYFDRDDILIGMPVHGRPSPDYARVVGLFMNTMVYRSRIKFNGQLSKVVSTTQDELDELLPFQNTPLDKVVSVASARRTADRNTLFQTLFACHEKVIPKTSDLGLLLDYHVCSSARNKVELTLEAFDTAAGLQLRLEYNNATYSRAQIERMLRHYLDILQAVLRDGAMALEDIPLFAPSLDYCGAIEDASSHYSSTILCQLTRHCDQRPDAPALKCPSSNRVLTYAELVRSSRALAGYLLSKGVEEESNVLVCMERSIEYVISCLGVWMAGGCVVPADPVVPKNRLEYLVTDSEAKFILSKEPMTVANDNAENLYWSGDNLLNEVEIARQDFPPAAKGRAAYIMYTSGTTGQPKGVLIEHGGLARRLEDLSGRYGIEYADSILFSSSVSFDAQFLEWALSLVAGATTFVAGPAVTRSPIALQEYLNNHQIKFAFFTPSVVKILSAQAFASVKVLIVGGEACTPAHIAHIPPSVTIQNAYGPTEITICCTTGVVSRSAKKIDIGLPMAGSTVAIMDSRLKRMPHGAVGTIFVGGEGLARGYWRLDELSKKSFVLLEGRRLYNTGDTGRILDNGRVDYLGRRDNQVKVNGVRIELEEIERRIASVDVVGEVKVTVVKSGDAGESLVAYVKLVDRAVREIDPRQCIRGVLGEYFPPYMMPRKILFVEQFPLTPSGKVDVTALREMLDDAVEPPVDVSRRELTSVELILAQAWSEVLSVSCTEISSSSNFFDIGGDSIRTMELISLLYRKGYALEPADVLGAQTIEGMAYKVKRLEARTSLRAYIARHAKYPVLPTQRWFLDEDFKNFSGWVIPLIFELPQELDAAALRLAVEKVVLHHEALRSVYLNDSGDWFARVEECQPHRFFRAQEYELSENDAYQFFQVEGRRLVESFDLKAGPLFGAVLFANTASGTNHLLIAFHHLVVDATSIQIVLQDLKAYYDIAARDSVAVGGLHKSSSVVEVANAVQNLSFSKGIDSEVEYWKCKNFLANSALPFSKGYCDAENTRRNEMSMVREYPIEIYSRIYEKYFTKGESIFTKVLAASLAQCLFELSDADELSLLLVDAARSFYSEKTSLDLSRTVGWLALTPPVFVTRARNCDRGDEGETYLTQILSTPNGGRGFEVLYYLGDRKLQQVKVDRSLKIVVNFIGEFGSYTDNELLLRQLDFQLVQGSELENNRCTLINCAAFIKDRKLYVDIRFANSAFDVKVVDALETVLDECLMRFSRKITAKTGASIGECA